MAPLAELSRIKLPQGVLGVLAAFLAWAAFDANVRDNAWELDFLVECTDFRRKHPEDYEYVCERLRVLKGSS